MACRNRDFDTVPRDMILSEAGILNETGAFARTYVMELYRD
jgi:hypothetical protein